MSRVRTSSPAPPPPRGSFRHARTRSPRGGAGAPRRRHPRLGRPARQPARDGDAQPASRRDRGQRGGDPPPDRERRSRDPRRGDRRWRLPAAHSTRAAERDGDRDRCERRGRSPSRGAGRGRGRASSWCRRMRWRCRSPTVRWTWPTRRSSSTTSSPPEAVAALREMRRVARAGVVVNDLRRGRIAYALTAATVLGLARHHVHPHRRRPVGAPRVHAARARCHGCRRRPAPGLALAGLHATSRDGLPVTDLDCDVLVVGAGPAGSAVAAALARERT